MSVNTQVLAAALRSVGVATVFAGDPFTNNGLVALGVTEGDITLSMSVIKNPLTAPEYTGDIPHTMKVMAGAIVLTVPLIMGDTALWPKIMPTGIRGMGWSTQQTPTTTSVVVIPNDEITAAGLSYAAAVWTPAAPINAIWLWKASISPGDMSYSHGNGGKVIMSITVDAWFDAARPEGHKVFTIGNPVTSGITTILI